MWKLSPWFSSPKSSTSVDSSCCSLNLFIAKSSKFLIEIFPSPISLNDITVFLSLSAGTNASSPALSWAVLSFANRTKSYWLSVFSKQSSTVIRAIWWAISNENLC